MRFDFAKRTSCPRSHSLERPFHGRSAPWEMLSDSSGMTLAQSIPSVRPNPRQAGHAPTGDW